jgi:hypothetical protein
MVLAWDAILAGWTNHRKRDYVYNDAGNLTQDSYSGWDSTWNGWVYQWKHDYFYNTDSFSSQGFYAQWDTTSKEWIYQWKKEYQLLFNARYLTNYCP